MLRGLYSAASGITAAMMDSDVVANNLANMGTTGFKKVGVNYAAFGDVLMKRIQGNNATEIGSLNNGVQVVGTQTAFNQGLLKQTGNPLDLALDGKGFFTVQNPANGETYYTRNGAFTQNPQGVMVTQDGFPVMSDRNQPMVIPQGTANISISTSGLVSAIDGRGQSRVVGQMKITNVENPDSLDTQGAYLYKPTDETKLQTNNATSKPTTVIQGSLEAANVNVVEELIRSMTGSRKYESLQKAIRMQDKTLEQAVTQVGRYR